ncbi:hypothetical protein FOL46_004679, partial [Perkinsus olseni]
LYAMRGLLTGAVATIPLVLCPDPYLRAALSAAFIARALDIATMREDQRTVGEYIYNHRSTPCDLANHGEATTTGELDIRCRTEEKPLDPSSFRTLSRGELPSRWHTASVHQTSRRLGVLAAPTIERAVMYGGGQRGGSPVAKSVLRALVLSMALHLPPQLLRKSSIVDAVSRDWQTIISRTVSTSSAVLILRWAPAMLHRATRSFLPKSRSPVIRTIERLLACWIATRAASKMLCSLDLRLMLAVSLVAWPLRVMSIQAMERLLTRDTTALLDPVILAPLLEMISTGRGPTDTARLGMRLALFALEALCVGAAGATLIDAYLRQPLLVTVVDYKFARRLLDDDRKHTSLFYDGGNRIALHQVI